ncbi:hypothetical protein [Bifidobacterium sp.]|nr:hypothetical protein [Bifidobacterium sp.]MCI1224597.1 hypothetical protein [Bifidobacterium sp.]
MEEKTSNHTGLKILASSCCMLMLSLAGVTAWAVMNKRNEMKELSRILQESTKDLSKDAKAKLVDTAGQISEVLGK